MGRLRRIWRHLWIDERTTHRVVPDDVGQRLSNRIAASEVRHTGEVRFCVEAALPWSVVWHCRTGSDTKQAVRERALEWFGRLHLWDTEQNNGVLIYLLLAERAVEIVADRGLARHVSQSEWDGITQRLGERLRAQAFEDGLTEALEEVTALLVQHHPAEPDAANPDELSNVVVRA